MAKYFKNMITLTVLSEDSLEDGPLDLSQIVGECTGGGYVMYSEDCKTDEVTADEMRVLLDDAGSNPGFFMLADDDA